MGPNNAELVRVFTRETNAAIADTTLPVSADFDVVVEAKAGSAIHGTGAAFCTNIVVRDITANDDIPPSPAVGFGGAMHTHAWPNVDHQFVYTVPTANLVGRENHLCQVLAFLRVGITNPYVSFAVSPLFLLI